MEVVEEGVIEEGQDARPLGHALWVGHDHVNESWHAVTQVSVVSTVNVPHHLYLSQEKKHSSVWNIRIYSKVICKTTEVLQDRKGNLYFFFKILR